MKAFTSYEEHQDVVFGLCYLVIALLTANRLWGVALRGRKVIIAFNSLILATSLLRATWFFIPNYYLEPSYVPLPVRAWKDSPWRGVFVSQLLLTSGTLSLYGCFIVIACYWAHILQKLHYSEGSQPGTAALEVSAQVHGGTLRRFSFAAAGLLAVEAINALCFLCGVYNSEAMVLYDCLIFAIVSLVVARHIVGLSEQMARAIDGLQVISRSTSQAQARRIHAMMVVATAFFVSRVVLECLLGIPVLWRIYDYHNFVGNSEYWTVYILLKHGCEVVALGLSLLVSSAIKSYDSSRRLLGPALPRHNPVLQARAQLQQQAKNQIFAVEQAPLLGGRQDSSSHYI